MASLRTVGSFQLNTSEDRARRKNGRISVPPLKGSDSKVHNLSPSMDVRSSTPEKKPVDNYSHRIKSINSPYITSKSHLKNYRLHSKRSIYKRKLSNLEVKEEVAVRKVEVNMRTECKLKKIEEVCYNNQRLLVPCNKSDHNTVRIAEKDGLSNIRDEIINFFPISINSSNAVSVVPPQRPNYMYYLSYGNNSDLIKRILMSRPWWTQADEETFPNVNLAWTQTLNQTFIHTIPLAEVNARTSSDIDLNLDTSNLDPYSLGYGMITNSLSYAPLINKKIFASASIRIHNILEFNCNLSDKKHLYMNMKKYYNAIGENVFDYLPLTFQIEKNEEDSSFLDFV